MRDSYQMVEWLAQNLLVKAGMRFEPRMFSTFPGQL